MWLVGPLLLYLLVGDCEAKPTTLKRRNPDGGLDLTCLSNSVP